MLPVELAKDPGSTISSGAVLSPVVHPDEGQVLLDVNRSFIAFPGTLLIPCNELRRN